MVTPVHITKRALAVVGGRDQYVEQHLTTGCGLLVEQRKWGAPFHPSDGYNLLVGSPVTPSEVKQLGLLALIRVKCLGCLVLLDAELEGRGAEAQRQRAEIEAGR